MALMTNGYVRKDSNSKMGFLPPTSTEALMMGDGSLMDTAAFRDGHPTTKYTPAELGMDVTASPFYDPETTQAAKAQPQPSEGETVAQDSQTAADSEFGADTLNPLGVSMPDALQNFNSWASLNVGKIILGAGVLYLAYRLGANTNAS
ncbi:MAG: hypothetical protein ACTSPB_18455 [Candidatus Thorarchaeota archaeon]